MGHSESHRPRLGKPATALLVSPTIWMVYFVAVYVVAEWVCGLDRTFTVLGADGLTLAIVGATALAVAGIVIATIRLTPRAGDHRVDDHGVDDLGYEFRFDFIARLLAGIFVAATLIVGITPLVVGPC